MDFQIITDSCCDFPTPMYGQLGLTFVPLTVEFRGNTFDDKNDDTLKDMYQGLRAGEVAKTSAVNPSRWSQAMEEALAAGKDVLVLAFSSGLSTTYQSAVIAAEELKDGYPDRKIQVIDTLCASMGEGLLVWYACKKRDEGLSLDEVAQWVLDNRNKVHHQFFSSDMTQFRRTGRVSGAAATVATVLNICPIMRLDDKGAIKAYSKVRGKKKAVETTVDTMEQHAQGGRDYDGKCFICHSQCPEDARLVMDAVEERFPKLKGKIRLCDIGTIIGSHAGQGTVAVFFMGDERPEME